MPMPKNYIVEPQLPNGQISVGTEGGQTEVFIGRVAEFGAALSLF